MFLQVSSRGAVIKYALETLEEDIVYIEKLFPHALSLERPLFKRMTHNGSPVQMWQMVDQPLETER